MRRSLVLARTPREWNRRVLTLEDFAAYCRRERIVVEEIESCLPDLYTIYDDEPYITIHPGLRGAERVFTCFHELAHYWLHPPGIHHLHQMHSIAENEADVVAACAMVPITLLTNRWPAQIIEDYGYPPDLVDLRLEIFHRYQI